LSEANESSNEPDDAAALAPEPPADASPKGPIRRLLRKPAFRWAAVAAVVIVAFVGWRVWSEVQPVLTAVQASDVSYKVPDAPRLAANTGETVYRIDAGDSKVTYSVDENIVGQTASTATGTTSGIAGDIAVNAANPSASRVGQIVIDIEQLHSDNNLRDARIRQDFLESHANPLAQFTVDSLSGMPATITDGQSYDFTMTGKLTVKGKTTPVTLTANGKVANDQLTVTANTTVKMSDLGIGPINLAGLVSTGDDVKLSLDLTAVDPAKVTIPTEVAAPASGAPNGKSPSFKSDVAPILASNCASCHIAGQSGAAHWDFETAGDAAKIADGIGTVVKSKYMPPWPASNVGVPLDHSKALSQQDIDTLVAWSQAGGQLDEPADTKIPPAPNPQTTVQPRHDVTLTMPDAYTGSLQNPNDYRCFVLDPHLTTAMYMTGYEVTPGQRQEIHHAQIFHIDATQAAEGEAMGGKDGQPGWSCYAGPSLPDAKSSSNTPGTGGGGRRGGGGGGFSLQPGLVAGWVPGQDPSIYPENSGILLQPGDALVLQVHYHYEDQPTPDQTSVALQLDPGTANIKPIQIVNPLAPVEIPCMPGQTAPLCDRNAALQDDARLYGPTGAYVEQGLLALCRETPDQMTQNFNGIASSTCDSKVPTSGTIVADMGHMHTLGKSFRLTLDPGQPNSQVLLDIPVWNFDWQMNYQLQTPIHVNKGDTIQMQCTWDRSLDPNRPPKYIVFAEGTEDEMCFSTYALIPDQSPNGGN
jgi:polyisoprenoid-binding protein YceI